MAGALEADFHEAMAMIYRRAAREINYRPKVFLDMITMQGGLAQPSS